MFYWSAQIAIAKYHRLSGLNNRNIFLTVLGAGESKIRVPAWLGSSEDSFWLADSAAYLLCPHTVGTKTDNEFSGVS